MSDVLVERRPLPRTLRQVPAAVRRSPVGDARTLSPHVEDRWSGRAAPKSAMLLVLLFSATLHGAGMIATLLLAAPAQSKPQEAITVEVVPEMPKPEPAKPPATKGASSAVTEPTKEPAKAEPPAAAQPEPPATPPKPQQAPADEQAAERKAMRDELAQLQAEQAALQDEQASLQDKAALRDLKDALRDDLPDPSSAAGTGPLSSSLQAVALPEASGEGEVVGYAALVFSRLAKAKAVGSWMGMPGTAGVRFTIDAKGALVEARLAVSSGIAELDREALDVVRKAAPFPPPPPDAQRAFEANVSFVVAAGR